MAFKCNEICSRLESWFEGPRGQYLLTRERQLTTNLLETVFGYHQLQLGVTRNQLLAQDSPLGHKIYSNSVAGGDIGLLSEPDCLPFANDSIDVVILHHALEFSERPHALLREVHRVLAPQGHIVVLAFNPLSLFCAGATVAGLFPDTLWKQSRTIGIRRLKDWLHLLGAEIKDVRHCFAIPPAGGSRVFRFLSRADAMVTRHQLPIGGVYALHAQKMVSTLTPTRIRWRQPVRSRLIGLSVPKPVASPRGGDVAA